MSCFFERQKSDFPEFDEKYLEVLLPENADILDKLASYNNFAIFHHDLWNSTGRRFAYAIINECIKACPHEEGRNHIRKHFGINNDTNI